LEGYAAWDVFNEIYNGVKNAAIGGYEGSKQAVRLGYDASKDATIQAVKAIPKINREVAQLPEKIANSYTPTSISGQVLATGAYTLGKAAYSGLTLPLELASETITFAQDRKRENVPVFGPIGSAIGQTTAEFAENPNIENGARMVGAYSGGALLAFGGAKLATKIEATLTTESKSGLQIPNEHVGGLSSEEANAPHIEKGNRPPYTEGSRTRDIVLIKDRVLARVHGEGNQARSWTMRQEEIEGLSAPEIKDKFALPELPEYVSDVNVPKNTRLRVGTTGRQDGWGEGGGTQYELMDRIPEENFVNRRRLE
jgi:hypothetical protein